MIESHTIYTCPSGDVTLAYRLFGRRDPDALATRTPVLFIHGLSYFSYDWVKEGLHKSADLMLCKM